MQKIKSFQVDHTKLNVGMYISRIDDDIVTYDIRLVKPNSPPFLETPAIHTIEHIFATFVRNKYPSNIIYFGPMGCRTGFYLITRGLTHKECIILVIDSFNFISTFNDEIPGATKIECGNYLEHDLKKAKVYAAKMIPVLKNLKDEDLYY